jgi:putative glutamine amidotransferase
MKLVSAMYDCFYPFKEMGLFSDYEVAMSPDELDKDSCVVVWGGADISPSLYNRAVSKETWAEERLSHRDAVEWNLMQGAKELGIPIIGICRGAQMLCALAGGFLIQDITNHGSGHYATTSDGKVLKVSSLHHQMMYPWEVDHELVAQSKHRLSRHYLDVDTHVEVPCEPEFVYFPKERGIAIQWHPEYMDVNCEANNFVKEKVKHYVYSY